MNDLIPTALYALLTAIAAAVIASIATSVRLLPEVIDLSIIPTIAGLGSLSFTSYGALRRFDPDRLGRLALGGTVLGGAIGVLGLLLALILDVT
jgi:hypothetical protein